MKTIAPIQTFGICNGIITKPSQPQSWFMYNLTLLCSHEVAITSIHTLNSGFVIALGVEILYLVKLEIWFFCP